ncbi:MAG: YggT family protein [Prochlorothrix sp.]|nr:YggT family protein [Prochlorothrix sp.]
MTFGDRGAADRTENMVEENVDLIFLTIVNNCALYPHSSPPSFAMPALNLFALALGLVLAALTLCFILRIVLTWYPQVELSRFPFNVLFVLTEPALAPTRKLIQPLGGVDITPILWVGIISLIRELLLGQQGLITLTLRSPF